MRHLILLLAFLFLFPFTTSGQTPLLNFLKSQAVCFKEIPGEKGFSACYEIFLKQAVDPKHPEKGYFNQKMYLSHRDVHQPPVLFISGYEARKNVIKDWITQFKANQIFVEHRYFGQSKPDRSLRKAPQPTPGSFYPFSGWRIYELKAKEVLTLQQAVSIANDLFTAGYASYLEVITAQRNVLEAELGLANLRQRQFLEIIDLYRALGGGWN